MAVRIRLQGGPFAGRLQEFGDDVPRITLGRDPDACQVVVALPGDPTVGREHCTLVRVGDGYRLEDLRDHLVTVNDVPASEGDELPASADLRLGPGGPTLVVETIRTSVLPETGPQGRRAPSTRTRLERLDRRARRAMALGVLGLAAAAGVAIMLRSLGRDVSSVQLEVTSLPARIQEQTGGTLVAALNAAQASVYLVGARDKDGSGFAAIGTAWVVGPDLLATNAHVAHFFRVVKPEIELVVRSSSTPPADFVIRSVAIHPGYGQFTQITRSVCPQDQGLGGQTRDVQLVPACDVATLTVDLAGRSLGAPLPLATLDELAGMRPGDRVGFVGYPTEGLVGVLDAKAPRPTTQVGRVVGVVDFFHGERGELERQLVKHSLPSTGGASGSPIFNARGHVVALLNAGNIAGTTPRGRIPHAAMVNFGQRADLLSELVDGTAAQVQGARSSGWEAHLQTVKSCRPSDDDFWRTREAEWRQFVAPARTSEAARITTKLSSAVGGERFAAEVLLPVPADDAYAIIALARRGVVAIEVPRSREGEDREPSWWDGATLQLARQPPRPVRLVGGPQGVEVEVRAYGRVLQSRDALLRDLESRFATLIESRGVRLLHETRGRLEVAGTTAPSASFSLTVPNRGRYVLAAIATEPSDVDLEVFDQVGGAKLAENTEMDWYPSVRVEAPSSQLVAVVSGENAGSELDLRLYAPEPQ